MKSRKKFLKSIPAFLSQVAGVMIVGASLTAGSVVYAPTVLAQASCPANGDSFCKQTSVCTGLNAGFFNYASLDRPFIDQARGAAVSVSGYSPNNIARNPAIPLDENKYPTDVDRTITVLFYSNVSSTHTVKMLPSGRYVVLWDGAASQFTVRGAGASRVVPGINRLVFHFDAGKIGNTFFSYVNASRDDHLRNIRIVPIEYESQYASWNWSQYKVGSTKNPEIFFTQWIDKMSSACTIRYMNATNTNDRDAVDLRRDSSSSMIDPASMVWYDGFGLGSQYESKHGLPWEIIVEMTLQTKTRPWINLRVMAYENHMDGDPVIGRISKLFGRFYGGAMYVEYANEIWNTAYPFNIATNHVRANGPGTRNDVAENYSLRNNVIQEAFARSYTGEECLVMGVLASQGRNPSLGQQMLTFADTNYVDVLSPTTYVGEDLSPGNPVWNFVDRLKGAVKAGNMTKDQAFRRIRNELLKGSNGVIVKNWRNDVGPFTQTYIDMADAKQMCTAFYEGGLHMRLNDIEINNPDHQEMSKFVREYQRSKHQAAVEKEVTDYLKTRSTGPNVVFSSFENAGGGTFSYWDSVFENRRREAARATQIAAYGDGGGLGVISKIASKAIEKQIVRTEKRLKRTTPKAYQAPEQKGKLLALLGDIKTGLDSGSKPAVLRAIRKFRIRVNGCGEIADSNDYVVSCRIQGQLQGQVNTLRKNARAL